MTACSLNAPCPPVFNLNGGSALYRWVMGCLLFNIGFTAVAGTASTDDPAPSSPSLPLHHEHDFSIEPAWQLHNASFQSIEATLKSHAELNLTPALELNAATRVRVDAFDRLEPGQPDQAETAGPSRRLLIGDRGELELREFFLRAQTDLATITVGKQQIIWGTADGLRLLDVVNPHDYRKFILDDFVDSRIPLWALNVEAPIKWPWKNPNRAAPPSTFLQAIWLPDKTYNRFPEPGAVYEFTSPLFVPTPPPGMPAQHNPPQRPNHFFLDSDAGLRLSSFMNNWDLSLNYLYHYDDNPAFFRETTLRDEKPLVVISPRYQRSHLLGGTASTAFGSWTFRTETAAFLKRPFSTGSLRDQDGVIGADEWSLMLGLDWFGFQNTIISWQWFQSTLIQNEPLLFRDRLESNFTQLVRREFFDARLTLEFMWLHGLNRHDGLLQPRVSWEYTGNSKIWLGADIFYGDRQGLFGQFDRRDRLLAGLQIRF